MFWRFFYLLFSLVVESFLSFFCVYLTCTGLMQMIKHRKVAPPLLKELTEEEVQQLPATKHILCHPHQLELKPHVMGGLGFSCCVCNDFFSHHVRHYHIWSCDSFSVRRICVQCVKVGDLSTVCVPPVVTHTA